MTPQQLEQQLKDALITAANVQQRDYLGMSSIGQCPRKIFFELVEGKPDDDRLAWYSYAGYMHEHSLIRLMGFEPPAQQIEVVSAFDSRFRGHVDYVLADGTLIECKSVDWSNFTKLYGGPKAEHVDQVQMYLRHGGWPRALIVYTARDIVYREWAGVPIRVFEILPDPARQDALDAKARDILLRLPNSTPPDCTCGWCRR